jgi:hypothetical protein
VGGAFVKLAVVGVSFVREGGKAQARRIGFSAVLFCQAHRSGFTSFAFLSGFDCSHLRSLPVFPFSSVTMPTRNPTGFDIGQFKAAASPSSVYAKRDPWVR